jgi:peptide/nickel transport system substrate-binding protein
LLNANAKRLGGFAPTIKTIELIAVSDSDTLNYTLQIGNIDFFFTDLSNGDYRRINASSVEVGLNNLVYLGLNTGSAKLQTTAVRQAISLLIDKSTLVSTAFQGHASVAHTPFNPDFAGIAGYDFVPDTENAVALLEQAGYTKIHDRGIRYSGYSSTLDFKLLVNADNAFKVEAAKLIEQDLMKAGINVTVTALDFEAYSAAIRSWKFDMYLGEVMLTPDMSLNPLLTTGGSITYGINTSTGAAASSYYQYKTGAVDTKEFVDAFAADVPFVPLCYRNGIVAYSRELIIPQNYTTSDIYFGIEAWTF